MMFMIKRVSGIGLVAVAALLVAGCGDDDDDSSSSADGGSASNEIDATATNFEFDPASWTVNAGEEFTIDFTNDGNVEHEWAVIKLGDDLDSEADFAEDKVLFEVEAIDAGTSTSEAFTVEEAGTYQVICAINTHFNAGMEGSLFVE